MSKITKIVILAVIALGIIGAIKMNNTPTPATNNVDGSSVLIGEGTLSSNFCHNGFSNVSSFVKDANGQINGCELSKCDGGTQTFSFSGDPLAGCTGDLEGKLSCVIDKCIDSSDELKTGSCNVTYSTTNESCTVSCPGSPMASYHVTTEQYNEISSGCQFSTETATNTCLANGCSNAGTLTSGGDTEVEAGLNSSEGEGDLEASKLDR